MPTIMQVPKTPMNKNDLASRYKHKVWFTRETFTMKRVTIAQ
jgi:hypothetical protein